MGCDIHIYTEKYVNGKWLHADGTQKNKYFGKWKDEPEFCRAPIYNGRNYNLFAILADVRNGSGFAGCYTGSGFIPIHEPKGLPDDVSDEIREAADDWGSDGHSHSYFTVKELLQYKHWNDGTTSDLYGIIPATKHDCGPMDSITYQEWRKNRGKPDTYFICGGKDIEVVSEARYLELEKQGWLDNSKKYFVGINWGETYADTVGEFYTESIPKLKDMCETNDYSDVRIVFWFDN